MPSSFFTAHQLQVSIADNRILEHLDFELNAGELTGIIGPNGSGKTTLLRTMSGILGYQGSLVFEGHEINTWDKKQLARHMAVLPQNPDVNFDFTVQDYVMLGRIPHKGWLESENAADRQTVDKVLEELDLRNMAGRFLPTLSGGERQRVLLARALVQETPTLLLDEPTQHLDVYHQFDLLKRIRQLVDRDKSVVIVFHDLALAARFTDALLVMQAGRVISHGKTRDVLTPALIQDVFRMKAHVRFPVDASDSQPPSIHFLDQL